MYFLIVEVQKSAKQTDQQVSPFSTPLDGNTNLFLDLWFCLFELHCIISCVNSLITVAPRQPAGVDGQPPEYTCIQWNPDLTQDFTGCVCVCSGNLSGTVAQHSKTGNTLQHAA